MRNEYNKLVRDRIPQIIRDSGRECASRVLSYDEYVASLQEKLVEEAQEAARADPAKLARELADVCEVIDALAAALGIDRAEILQAQARKRQERGGFAGRTCLLWAE